MSKLLNSVLLSLVLITPVALRSQDRDDHGHSYHDAAHHDDHQWNANEDKAYHQYLKENHKKDHDWEKAKKKEQANYWNWRHEHPDAH